MKNYDVMLLLVGLACMASGCATTCLIDHIEPHTEINSPHTLDGAFVHNHVLTVTGTSAFGYGSGPEFFSVSYSLSNITNTINPEISEPIDSRLEDIRKPKHAISVPIKNFDLSHGEVATTIGPHDFSQIALHCTNATIFIHPDFADYCNLKTGLYKKEPMWFLFADGTYFSIMRVPSDIKITKTHYHRRLYYIALPFTISLDIVTSPLVLSYRWLYKDLYR